MFFLYLRFNISDPALTAKVKVKETEEKCVVDSHCCIAFSNVHGKMRMSRGKFKYLRKSTYVILKILNIDFLNFV